MPTYSLAPQTGLLGKRLAAHLLRRCSFNFTGQDINNFANKTAAQAITDLLTNPPTTIPEPLNPYTGQPWVYTPPPPPADAYQLAVQVNNFWMEQFSISSNPTVKHKMIWFLHQQIATKWRDFTLYRCQWDYVKLLEYFCIGDFKALAYRMCTDNLMSLFLGNTYNNKSTPNENFAREFLELFTIGKGSQDGPGSYTTYTEDDVKSAAKVLTGFYFNSDYTNSSLFDPLTGLCRNLANVTSHTLGDKQFSTKFQNTLITGAVSNSDMWRELQDFVNMVFAQQATAKNICRNLYRYFCCTEITADVETYIITPLAATFQNNNYNLSPVLSQLLQSQHFFGVDANDNRIVGSKEKSPLDIFENGMSFWGLGGPMNLLDKYHFFFEGVTTDMADLGLDFLNPEAVAGYPPYYQQPLLNRLWETPTILVARYKYGKFFVNGISTKYGNTIPGFVPVNLSLFVKNNSSANNSNPMFTDPATASTLVTEFCQYLLPEIPTGTRFSYLLNTVFLGGLSPINWQHDWNNYISTGDVNYVKPALDNFINTLYKIPEFQLF